MQKAKKNGTSNGAAESDSAAANNNRNTKKPNLKKLSHQLSWALRHAAPDIGLGAEMTPDGYVPVREILNCRHPKLRGSDYTLDDIRRVVETSDKQRYRLEERPAKDYYPDVIVDGDGGGDDGGDSSTKTVLCIRANQGHSIPNIDPNLLLTRLSPEELASTPTIVHGTYDEPWRNGIRTEGLKRMTRNHIHFASGLPTSSKDGDEGGAVVISGMRRTCTVYVYVDGKKCAEDGIEFYRSDNGVLLTAGVGGTGTLPVRYFSHVTDASGRILLDQHGSEK